MNYGRYGLGENPYCAKVLECHKNPADSRRFLPIHPSVDERRLVDSMRDAIQNHTPVFYVVVGTSGSGRTAVAGRILRLYQGLREARARREKQQPPKTAAFERENDGNIDARQVGRGILRRLGDRVADLGTDFEDNPVAALHEGLAKLQPDYSIDDLASLAMKFSRRVYKLDGCLACLIENVPNAEVLRALRRIFKETEAVVVCTVKSEQTKEVLDPLGKDELADRLKIELDKLTPEKAFALASFRWKAWKGRGAMPFHSAGLLNAFSKPLRTVGKSLGTLRYMIDTKLINYPGNSVWPEDTGLGFEPDQIEDNFKLFDEGKQ